MYPHVPGVSEELLVQVPPSIKKQLSSLGVQVVPSYLHPVAEPEEQEGKAPVQYVVLQVGE